MVKKAKKNTLYYKYDKYVYDKRQSAYSDKVIQVYTPQSSCWFSSLHPFLNRLPNLLEVFKFKHSEFIKGRSPGNTITTSKVCPGIRNILTNSLIIRTPVDIAITIEAGGGYVYDVAGGDSSSVTVSHHPQDQFLLPESSSPEENIFKDKVAIKINLGVSYSVPNTYSEPLVLLPPQYHTSNTSYQVVMGVIGEGYRTNQSLNIIAMFEEPTKGAVTHIIKAGTVLAYLWASRPYKIEYDEPGDYVINHRFTRSFIKGRYVNDSDN